MNLPEKQIFQLETNMRPVSGAAVRDESEHKLSSILTQIQSITDEEELAPAQGAIVKGTRNVLRAFIATDILAMLVGFASAWLLSSVLNTFFYGRDVSEPVDNNIVLVMQFASLSAGVMFWFLFTNHYQTRVPFWMETRKIVEAMSVAVLINCFLQVVYKEDVSRVWLLSAWIFSTVSIVTFRGLARKGLQALKVWTVPALMIGEGRTAEEARHALSSDKNLGYEIIAQIGDLNAIKQPGFSWVDLCNKYKAQHVVVAVDAKDMVQAQNALGQLMREHVEFSIVPPTQSFPVVGVTPQFFLGQDVMLLNRSNGLEYPLPRLLKRAFDILISATALLVASPVIGLLALTVKRDGGKAFYGHKRIGLNGKAFYCLKLRSMVMNSNEALTAYLAANPEAQKEWARDHKLKDDPRVTKIGNFMRRTSLDELPQLLNVLRGEMSIVGPRPIVVAETAKYDNDIAYYYRVRPGVTGLWQVSGRSDVSYAERVRMDSWYVRNWSFWNDIAIICKTFSVVLKGRGAC